MTPTASLVFLPFVLAIGVWVAWSDMKFMKIPNKAVIALLVVYAVLGLILLPFRDWAMGLGLGVIVLLVGFILNAARAMGAGDAKFAAVMAPFFLHADPRLVMGLIAACLLGAFGAHRLMRAIPAMRRATPDWASWTHPKFPMGLALSGTLIFYLLAQLRPLF